MIKMGNVHWVFGSEFIKAVVEAEALDMKTIQRISIDISSDNFIEANVTFALSSEQWDAISKRLPGNKDTEET
jgi:hypothetical protein